MRMLQLLVGRGGWQTYERAQNLRETVIGNATATLTGPVIGLAYKPDGVRPRLNCNPGSRITAVQRRCALRGLGQTYEETLR